MQHMDAFTHLPENTSKKSFEVIQVELKWRCVLERERNCSRFFRLRDFRTFTHESASTPYLKIRIAAALALE